IKETNRAVVVTEESDLTSFGRHVHSWITQNFFWDLDMAPELVTAVAAPAAPYNAPEKTAFYPTAEDIYATLYRFNRDYYRCQLCGRAALRCARRAAAPSPWPAGSQLTRTAGGGTRGISRGFGRLPGRRGDRVRPSLPAARGRGSTSRRQAPSTDVKSPAYLP